MKLAPLLVAVASGLTAIALLPSPVRAATGAEISRNARAALETLYSTNPAARAVGQVNRRIPVNFCRDSELAPWVRVGL